MAEAIQSRPLMDALTELLGNIVSKTLKSSDQGIEIFCSSEDLARVCSLLVQKTKARLVSVAATDDRKENGMFGLRVIFSPGQDRRFITVVAPVRFSDRMRYPSIAAEVPAAHLFEREIMEFFGLVPEGHPDLRSLILHEDWPKDRYPLRKDFVQGARPERLQGESFAFLRVQGEGVFEVPVGPVHAGIIEPGHFRFSVAGEPIIHLEIRLGYLHKGIEKLAEGMQVTEAVQLCEQISGDASFAHSLAFCQAVENLAQVRAPEKARTLRVVYAELERLYNHLGDIAGIATDVGFAFGAAQLMRLREMVLKQNDLLTGHRLLRGVNKIGGVASDLSVDKINQLKQFLRSLLAEYEAIERLYLETESLMDRIEETGVLSNKIAQDFGGVGPAVRASGVDLDMRRDHPYAAYPELKFDIPVRTEGDVAARMLIKMAEFKQSVSIICQALDRLVSGTIAEASQTIPEGEALGWSESSRGEIVHWVKINASGKIDRLKIKSPSFVNWPLLAWAVRGNILPDFPLINKSFNLSYSGNDR